MKMSSFCVMFGPRLVNEVVGSGGANVYSPIAQLDRFGEKQNHDFASHRLHLDLSSVL